MTRKKNDPYVTKSMLDEAVDALLKGMDNLFLRFKTELKTKLKEELEPIKAVTTFIKRDIRDIRADLSNTPTKREFNELKTKVETLHSQS